jgi:hypothetical protein
MIWLKSLPYLVVGIACFLAGLVFDSKVLTKPCPACPVIPACPPTTEIKLQDFNVEKIKGVKSFTYSPQITGTFYLKVDSTTYQNLKK